MNEQEIKAIFATGFIKISGVASELYPNQVNPKSYLHNKLKGIQYVYFKPAELEHISTILKRFAAEIRKAGTVQALDNTLLNRGAIAAKLFPHLSNKSAAARMAEKVNGSRQFTEAELNQMEVILKGLADSICLEPESTEQSDGGARKIAGILAGEKIDPNIFKFKRPEPGEEI